MAFSFTTQPSANGLNARSPIIYAVTETTANDNYKYILDVYINDAFTTPASYSYRLVCSPDGSNVGKFDVSGIMKAALSPNYSINNASLTSIKDIDTGCRYIQCKGGFIDDSGVVNENEATSAALVRTYEGYLDYDEAQNTTNEAFGKKFTDMPTSDQAVIPIPESAIYYYPIVRSIYSSASWLDSAGSGAPISLGSLSTLASEDGRYIPIGTRQLVITEGAAYYDVSFSNASNTVTHRFVPTCEPKYDAYTLMFVNKYGFWDYLYFFKKSVETISSTKEEYNIVNPSASYEPQKKVYSKDGNESITLNSGFISEAFNEVYKQLMVSNDVMLVEKNGVTIQRPVNVKDVDMEFKKGVNEQLINYTLNLEYAYDVINKTW